jgi:alpha-1,2-mannosyltransferase
MKLPRPAGPASTTPRGPRALDHAVFGWAPLLFVGWLAWFVSGHGGAGDFAIFRRAGDAVLHGRTPYVAPTVRLLAQNDHFVYPQPFAYLFAPLALAPERVGALLFLAAAVAAVLAALRLLEVRDWRCYGAALLTVPVFGALGVGSIGPLLAVLVAAGWRYRDRLAGGMLLAIAAAAKLFLWPLLVWLLVTRRFRAVAAATATIGAILIVWQFADPHGLRGYLTTVRVLNQVERSRSYSLQTLALTLGGSDGLAAAVSVALAVSGVAIMVVLRRSEEAAFATAVATALFATPILWLHYLVLIFVPLALREPRLTTRWALPLLLWATPHPESMGSRWRIVLVLATLTLALLPRPPRLSGVTSRWANEPPVERAT